MFVFVVAAGQRCVPVPFPVSSVMMPHKVETEPQSKRSLGFASRLAVGRPSAVPGRRKKMAICGEERRRHVEMRQGDS